MILSVGNDIVENERVAEMYKKHGDRFLKKLFTQVEADYCLSRPDPVPHLSARFCVKEAFVKAVQPEPGTHLDWREIELFGQDFGKKELVLHGKSGDLFHERGFDKSTVSVSHSDHYSTAVVILYKESL